MGIGSGFDDVVMVDWSAHSGPKLGVDSIWIAHGQADSDVGTVRTCNPPTRSLASEHLGHLVAGAAARARTMLVGFDFSFGYPDGFAACTAGLAARGDSRAPWRRTWDLLSARFVDGPDNRNDRFAVADRINRETGRALFWGRPAGGRHEALRGLPIRRQVPADLGPNPCHQLRITERLTGRGIKSNFQLFGGVTVGSQVVLGVPYLAALVRRFAEVSVVWPFDTGFVPDPIPTGPRVVFAEIWPARFDQPQTTAIRDEEQVRSVVRTCLAHDRDQWARWFCPASAAALAPHDRGAVLDEEGWILGVE